MKLTEYVIIAEPFDTSDLTSTFYESGIDEEDALKQFRKKHPTMRVQEVRER